VSAESELERRLRLLLLTDPRPAAGSLLEVVAECLEAGCRAIQLRDKDSTAEELYHQALPLRRLTSSHGALLFVNDRWDVAVAAGADGVHLGPDDVPIGEVRRRVPAGFLLGYSTDDPTDGRNAARAGADYLGVGAVYGTASKPGLETEAIGPERVGEVMRASGLPCVGIGGIEPGKARPIAAEGAGIAVLGAVMHSRRPGEVVKSLLAEISRVP
jgi:thiamine-phosphate pyrophosphorylase